MSGSSENEQSVEIEPTAIMQPTVIRNNGTFRWTEAKDKLLLCEVYTLEPFLYKAGSREAGQKWLEVADKLNCYDLFKEMPRDQRSVREHFNKLVGEFKKKQRREEAASGITPNPPTENETVIEEIIEIMNSTPKEENNSTKEEKKRKDAIKCRDMAMTTWSKGKKSNADSDSGSDESDSDKKTTSTKRGTRKRRGSSDAIQFLSEKSARESEFKEEELALRKEELRLRAEEQRGQLNMQQEYMKQMMQTQAQQQQFMLAFLEKMSK